MTAKEPPYGIDYAVSEFIKCRQCGINIAKGTLKMSIRQPSKFYDGIEDIWYHIACIPEYDLMKKPDTLSLGNVRNAEQLEWKDQERLRKMFNKLEAKLAQTSYPSQSTPVVCLDSSVNSSININPNVPEIRRMKNGLRRCQFCEQTILKGDLRIKLKAYFFHLECSKNIDVIHKFKAQELQGYNYLDTEEKAQLFEVFKFKTQCQPRDSGEPSSKKAKRKEKGCSSDEDGDENKLQKQANILWKVRRDITEYMDTMHIDAILNSYGRVFMDEAEDLEQKLDYLVDYIVFGVPERCFLCKGSGIIVYNPSVHRYTCTGYMTEYTKCSYQSKNPIRKPFVVPSFLMDNVFLRNQKFPTLPRRYYALGTGEIKSVHELFDTEDEELPDPKPPIVKFGCSVDGDCEVAEIAHVYVDKHQIPYQATLGETCYYENKNSYYKLQLLEHDQEKLYYIYCAQGRIGSNRGARRTLTFNNQLKQASDEFKKMFFKLTGNDWDRRTMFTKKGGKMDLLDVELNGFKKINNKFNVSESVSSLPKPVKELMTMIFDIESINKSLKAMNFDTFKMPLGKLSANHIKSANEVLKKLEMIVMGQNDFNQDQILDNSTRFYSKIPHVTGGKPPPLLDNLDLIHEKARMLDELLELEITYSILNNEESNVMDPIDAHYQKLNCSITPLDKSSFEYNMIKEYAQSTHGPTHGLKLDVLEAFAVCRPGEDLRFKSHLGNVNLLWHGSRTTNFAGIFSQGLRIAPKEAPSNGAMFGKGIYFADIVTKSANYCRAYGCQQDNNEGLLLLCEVALGQMEEATQATSNSDLPFGKASVKGCGGTIPDPSSHIRIAGTGGEVLVPKGVPISRKGFTSSLQYNEYIVYSVEQVRIRYAVRAKFR